MALLAESTNHWKLAEYFWKLDGKSKWWIIKWKFRTRKLRKKLKEEESEKIKQLTKIKNNQL